MSKKKQKKLPIGELFVIGFQGPSLPSWVSEVAARFGLGGVILFDFNYLTKSYDNNIQSPAQLKSLCASIHNLTSVPMVFIDQEGGKVRRLKENKGFQPLPSAKFFNALPLKEKKNILKKSFQEMKALGIDFNLAPVVDLDLNPENPDIGAVERSFSANPKAVEDCLKIYSEISKKQKLGLCLKHYPGLGGARTNSHLDLTWIDPPPLSQLKIFKKAPTLFANSILISHGIVADWDKKPVSLSEKTLKKLRKKLPNTLFISDDLQMEGLLKNAPLETACFSGLDAGLDILIIGNNLKQMNGQEFFQLFQNIEMKIQEDPSWEKTLSPKLKRIQLRKKLFRN